MVVLSIDQASNCAGVTLWVDDKLIAWTELKSNSPKDALPKRLVTQREQLRTFLQLHSQYSPDHVVCESVKSKMVMVVIGALLSIPEITCVVKPSDWVPSLMWKAWARNRGAAGKIHDVKGVVSLREANFPVDTYGITSDDIADAIMIYFAWRDRIPKARKINVSTKRNGR